MTALDRPFSYSQLSTFLRCPKAHDYSYRQGLQSLRPSVALQLGSLVDAGLTAALEFREPPHEVRCEDTVPTAIRAYYHEWSTREDIAVLLEMAPTMQEEAERARDDAIKIAIRAIRDLELDTDRWRTLRDKDGKLAVQYELEAPLRHHEQGYIGFADWIAEDTRTGCVWLIDFKVRSTFTDDDAMQFDYQLSSYQHVAEPMFDESFTGVALYQIKSKVPAARILKNKKLSTAAAQSCDWETYDAMAKTMGLSPQSYDDMRDKLPKFQSFTWLRRSKIELTSIWEQVEQGASELRRAHKDHRGGLRIMQPKICAWCDYKELCMVELRGHDSEFIREANFSVRE